MDISQYRSLLPQIQNYIIGNADIDNVAKTLSLVQSITFEQSYIKFDFIDLTVKRKQLCFNLIDIYDNDILQIHTISPIADNDDIIILYKRILLSLLVNITVALNNPYFETCYGYREAGPLYYTEDNNALAAANFVTMIKPHQLRGNQNTPYLFLQNHKEHISLAQFLNHDFQITEFLSIWYQILFILQQSKAYMFMHNNLFLNNIMICIENDVVDLHYQLDNRVLHLLTNVRVILTDFTEASLEFSNVKYGKEITYDDLKDVMLLLSQIKNPKIDDIVDYFRRQLYVSQDIASYINNCYHAYAIPFTIDNNLVEFISDASRVYELYNAEIPNIIKFYDNIIEGYINIQRLYMEGDIVPLYPIHGTINKENFLIMCDMYYTIKILQELGLNSITMQKYIKLVNSLSITNLVNLLPTNPIVGYYSKVLQYCRLI